MFHREPEKYLFDMLSSCEFLLDFTAGKTINNYIKDRAFRSALERELQIIGEALIQLEKIAPDIAEQIPEYQNIIGFRHVLVHGYANLPGNCLECGRDKARQPHKESQIIAQMIEKLQFNHLTN